MAYVVLGIDNDQESLDMIENYITKHRNDVTFLRSKSILEALEMIKQTPVDLVIPEYYLPDGNGIELVIEIRKLHPYLPIFFHSTLDDNKLIRQIHRKTRHIDFLVKYCLELDFTSALDYGLGLSTTRLVRDSFTVKQRFTSHTFEFNSWIYATQVKGKKQVEMVTVIDKMTERKETILLKNMTLTGIQKIIGNQMPVALSDRSNLVNKLMILGENRRKKTLILKYGEETPLGGKSFRKPLEEENYI